MSFFSTFEASDDDEFSFMPSGIARDPDYLIDGSTFPYGEVTGLLNMARAAVGLTNMVVGSARNSTLARAADQANERADREEERRQEAEQRAFQAQAQAEAAQAAAEEARDACQATQAELEATREKLKLEEELRKLGIQPNREVTDEEVRIARLGVGYVNNKTNIGIVGRQNDGKSTLVNCFRGVDHNAPESAITGETETTRRSKAYPDSIHADVVWHDIPGGGTAHTSAWGYYYEQKLFAYDKLLLAHSSTLIEMDVQILKICKYRSQECVVVRTKADDHVRNCKRRCVYSTVEEARNDFIGQVRRDTEAKNAEAGGVRELSPAYTDYIVCEMGITQLVCGREPSSDPTEQVIDEEALLRRLHLIS
ncbi:hypothetical protein F53441_6141 [Fusarium austroafricanum]|uniref:IRG-type G domain-containing protein n=1 Tax=Fusarium austroafricanum TaxID=2364996 RepID=A0A8H4NTP7_9HYPO|nr:hypothetical protein F53441_6141 [Fusarium austroafricanum]